MLGRILDGMPVEIAEDELIVGFHPESEPPPGAPPFATFVPDQGPLRSLPEALALRAGVFTSGAKTGHLTPDYPRLLSEGLGGIRGAAEERARRCPPDQRVQLQAMGCALRAASRFIMRYRACAEDRARTCTDPRRRRELEAISGICEHVSEAPPRSLQEALQLLWFAFLTQCIEEGEQTAAFALGRFDQYLHPFWSSDINRGVSRDRLEELVASFWVKLNEFSGLQVINLTIGGRLQEGVDAVNDVSFACLRLMADMRTTTPSLSVRVHPGIDADFLRQALALSLSGIGQPAFYSDIAAVRAMTHAGVSAADAESVVPGGCVELGVQGCCYPWVGNFFNLPKCLELALHDGVDPRSGSRIGPPTGPPHTLAGFDALLSAYQAQVEFLLPLMADSENATDRLEGEHNSCPFLSSLVSDCIDRGMDITAGGARYNFTEVQAVGIAHVVDSLLNVKRIVDDSGSLTLARLVEALDRDFAGEEPLRLRLRNLHPTYGDHVPETAALARRVVHHFFDAVERFRNPRGGSFHPGLLVWTLYDEWADCVGALPDGRQRGDALVSSIGPRNEAKIDSPTSIVCEVTGFDHYRCAGGLTFNLRFSPGQFTSPAGVDALSHLLEVYFQKGGMQAQFNVAAGEILRQARENPAAHPNLVVRVSGFSARFADLSDRIQDEIISRYELLG
jgi:formate C-acetyltransferase